jgi:hypothetical protein
LSLIGEINGMNDRKSKEHGVSKPPNKPPSQLREALSDSPDPITFSEVIFEEAGELRRRRLVTGQTPDENLRKDLTGLALSGGGIRSATFCLGVLQALGPNLLKRFDYLSTVSGGGFIGGWWSGFLSRPETEGIFPPAEKTEPEREYVRSSPSGSERLKEGSLYAFSDPVHHLRMFSNYLTPRKGALSSDSWRAVTTISRNLILTWLILLPMLLAAMLLADFFFAAAPCTAASFPVAKRVAPHPSIAPPALDATGPEITTVLSQSEMEILKLAPPPVERWQAIIAVAVFALSLMAIATLAWMIAAHEKWRWWDFIALPAAFLGSAALAIMGKRLLTEPSPRQALCSPLEWTSIPWTLLLWFTLLGLLLWRIFSGGDLATVRNRAVMFHQRLLVMGVLSVLALIVAGFGGWVVHVVFISSENAIVSRGGWTALLTAAAGSLFTVWKASPSGGADKQTKRTRGTQLIFAITPPLVVMVLAFLMAALAQHMVEIVVAQSYTPVVTIRMITLTSMTLFAILGVYEFLAQVAGWTKRLLFVKIRMLLQLLAWCVIIADLVILWRADKTSIPASFSNIPLFPWTMVGAVIVSFIILFELIAGDRDSLRSPSMLLLIVLALFVMPVLVWLTNLGQPEALHAAFGLSALMLGWVAGFGWLADPNALSMHLFYQTRLVRAYLGASNPTRAADNKDITDAVPNDDVLLVALTNTDRGGPYHIINTTLNLVAGTDLSTAQRSAASFELAKLYCGSLRTKFRPTDRYMGGRMSLGTAVSVSGAAASPNMGSKTPSGALAMLMTLFNIRLGYWAPTPHRGFWRNPQARLWPVYMFQEFLSQTNDLLPYCYLTDGGHFDNTGIYTLVSRACKRIVVVDCGADPKPTFADLGNAIRRCRIDFKAEIDINLEPFLAPPPERPHFISGTITYSKAHTDTLGITQPEDAPIAGRIVVIKPRLNTTESADIRQYALEHPDDFPQQSTAEQWFDEAQFESYRQLGLLSGTQAATAIGALMAG